MLSRIFIKGFILLSVFCSPVYSVESECVLIHFKLNEAVLPESEKQVIQDLFKDFKLPSKEKILVIGYTDSTGKESFNYDLSKERAISVKKSIVASSKIKPTLIVAKGYGPRSPIDSNTSYQGRALNRRVEIYTRGVAAGFLQDLRWVRAHNQPHIISLIEESQSFVFEQNFDQALLKLMEAEKLGGKRYSDWHLTYGISGYFSGLDMATLKPIFQFALSLDPYNTRARDYLARIQAREKFKAGDVGPQMGKTPTHPIEVENHYQEYEYIRLFQVSPILCVKNQNTSMDTCECKNEKGETITYYFRSTSAQKWAF